MASSFWALDAARRRRRDPVPGTSKWVANELYTVNSNVLSNAEKFAHGMSDDYDMLNGFMKSVMNGDAIRDYIAVQSGNNGSGAAANNAPKAWSDKIEEKQDDRKDRDLGFLDEQEKPSTVIDNRQPEFSSVIHIQQEEVPVGEPYTTSVAATSPIDPVTNFRSSMKEESPKISFSKIEPHTIFQHNSPVRSTILAEDRDVNNNNNDNDNNGNNPDADDSFQKIKTAIRKSIARTPAGNSKMVNMNPNPQTTAQSLAPPHTSSHSTAHSSTAQQGSPTKRKSGFVSLPTREPLLSIVHKDRRESSDNVTRKSTMHLKPTENKIEKDKLATADSGAAKNVAELPLIKSEDFKRRSRILSVIESLQELKTNAIVDRQGTQSRQQNDVKAGESGSESHHSKMKLTIPDNLRHSKEIKGSKGSISDEKVKKIEKEAASNEHLNEHQNDNENNENNDTTPKKKVQGIGFTGSVLRRARNLFLSEPTSATYNKQENVRGSGPKKSNAPELELPRQSLNKQSLVRRSDSRSRSPTRSFQLKTPKSPNKMSPVKRVQKLHSSPNGTPQKAKEPFKQSELINRLMAPTSSSAAKTSRPKLTELKKVDLGEKNKLLTATLNPTKPPKFSPNKNRYGNLRLQVSNRPIQSPIKRTDKFQNGNQPEELEPIPTAEKLYLDKERAKERERERERERDRDRERGRVYKPKQKIMIAVNHKLDSKVPQLKSSVNKHDFEYGDHDEESKRRKTNRHLSRSTATTPARRKSKFSDKSRISSSSGLNNPYKTPGKSNKSLLAPSELPEILTDDEDNRDKRVFENWAETPQLKRILLQQENINPDTIFGEIPPLNIEDIFESQASRQRGRASLSNWSPEAK